MLTWEQSTCPEPHVIAFTLRLTSLVIENEWQFSVVKEKQLLDRIQSLLRSLPQKKQTPTVQLANVVLMNAVARHSMGLLWIKQHAVWKVIVDYCSRNQTVYVVREAHTFLYTILKQFSMHIGDIAFVEEVLQTVCHPLMDGNPFKDFAHKSPDVVITVDDPEQLCRIVPALKMICHFMQEMITTNECHEVRLILFNFYLSNFHSPPTVINQLSHTHRSPNSSSANSTCSTSSGAWPTWHRTTPSSAA